MALNFEEGVSFEVKGEIGKNSTFRIERLEKIAENLQVLIEKIALADISESSAIDLKDFKIELSRYRSDRAVSEFVFAPIVEQADTDDIHLKRHIVNKKFEDLVIIFSKGEYEKIKTFYPDEKKRYSIVKYFYEFSTSFGKSPVNIVSFIDNEKIVPLYQLKQLLKTKLELIIPKEESVNPPLSYAPTIIETDNVKYILNTPLMCDLEKEENYYVITNEMLDITGTGLTIDEAKASFNQEFDHIYTRYNQLKDENLSERILNIKRMLQTLVKSVE
ncbi:MAG: hypothetical protein IPM47_01135 [Sphingobacteriales bacterium]|nr:MAG: hypothetical protein IPM47_01135 [Sphingobacteriales bacterium]